MKGIWTSASCAVVAWLTATAVFAQDRPWRPGATCPTPVVPTAAFPVKLGAPIPVTLGRPEALDSVEAPVRTTAYQSTPAPARVVARGQSADPAPPPLPALGAPQSVQPNQPLMITVRASGPLPGSEAYNSGVVGGDPIPPAGGRPGLRGGLFGCEWLGCTTGSGRKPFESDPCFNEFISPVTNPFLFEDPRSLTEVRPIFMYQYTPSSNVPYNGGNLWFVGTQARLAVTERLSVVMNKFGYVWSDPNNPAGGTFAPHSGFSELWVGPKLTIIRNDQTGTLLAAGTTLQIPSGSKDVFQDTGSLSVVPYVSFGQHFLKDFNFLTTVGYAIGDNSRTDYFFNSYHLDWDVGGLHRFYPLIELNWFHYAKNGGTLPATFEGRDLINFGSTGISGTDTLTLAVGSRFKINDCVQMGAALEFPLIRSRDLLDFRLTTDVIFRY